MIRQSGHIALILIIGSELWLQEKKIVEATINFCGGNKAKAARLLGISNKTIYNKLKRYVRDCH